MGRGASKAGNTTTSPKSARASRSKSGGNIEQLTPERKLEALQESTKGTLAEAWYNESGQSYDQLRAMENIYDLTGTPRNVRSYESVKNDPTLSRAMETINNAPNGTAVAYKLDDKTHVVMKKSALGDWTSYEIFSPASGMAVVRGDTYTKYTPIQALNTFTTLQSIAGSRRPLNSTQTKAYKKYF